MPRLCHVSRIGWETENPQIEVFNISRHSRRRLWKTATGRQADRPTGKACVKFVQCCQDGDVHAEKILCLDADLTGHLILLLSCHSSSPGEVIHGPEETVRSRRHLGTPPVTCQFEQAVQLPSETSPTWVLVLPAQRPSVAAWVHKI